MFKSNNDINNVLFIAVYVDNLLLFGPKGCKGDISYDKGSLQEVRTVTMTMTDVEYLRLI